MVQTGPFAGLIGELALLAALAGTVGLSGSAWTVGLAFGAFTCAALIRGLRRSGMTGLGPANRVTLARATLVGAVAALVIDAYTRPVTIPLFATITTVALMLDAVDGWVARRTGTSSALGARFDMEVDAFLIFVLSVAVARQLGPWVLAIGAFRYAYVVAGWALPWLRASVLPRYWRKVVAAIQGIVLAVVAAHVLPRPLAIVVVAFALALLTESFGRDIVWQWQHRRAASLAMPAGMTTTVRTARSEPAMNRIAVGTRVGGRDTR